MKMMFYLIISLVLSAGCSISSRTSMYGNGGRTAYNIAAQNTTNQELLLNLVRLRYSDTPYFLELNSITSQFTYGGKFVPSIPAPGFNQTNPGIFEGELSWQNQPTIQYAPLQGKDFAIQLMSPIDLRVIQGLIFTGWNVDRVFRLLVQNMSNVSNACLASNLPTPSTPPDYKEFNEIVTLMHFFQENNQLQIGVLYEGKEEENVNNIALQPNVIQIIFPSEGEKAKKLAHLLPGTRLIKGKYVISMRQDFNEQAKIGIMTRSLLSCMYYLSLGVEVPPSEVAAGIVGVTKCGENATPFNWHYVVGDLLTINWSYRCPQSAYLAVPYRGYWFYIDDTDIESKHTFVLLQQIYNLQAKQEQKETPLLSIPLG